MRMLTITTCTFLCLAAGPALAGEQDAMAGIQQWVDNTDADNNGNIDNDEYAAFLATHFDSIDRDGDNFIDENERQASPWCETCEPTNNWQFIAGSDRKMSREEYADTGMKALGRWDTDGDGTLTNDEFKLGLGFRTQ